MLYYACQYVNNKITVKTCKLPFNTVLRFLDVISIRTAFMEEALISISPSSWFF